MAREGHLPPPQTSLLVHVLEPFDQPDNKQECLSLHSMLDLQMASSAQRRHIFSLIQIL